MYSFILRNLTDVITRFPVLRSGFISLNCGNVLDLIFYALHPAQSQWWSSCFSSPQCCQSSKTNWLAVVALPPQTQVSVCAHHSAAAPRWLCARYERKKESQCCASTFFLRDPSLYRSLCAWLAVICELKQLSHLHIQRRLLCWSHTVLTPSSPASTCHVPLWKSQQPLTSKQTVTLS